MGSIAATIAKDLAGATATLIGQGLVKSVEYFRRALMDVIKTLSDFSKTLQETQQSLGIDLSAAARVQLDAMESSFNSVINVFEQFSKGTPTAAKDVLEEMVSNITKVGASVGGNVINGLKSGEFALGENLEQIRTGYQTFIATAEKAAAEKKPGKLEISITAEEFVKARSTIQKEFGVIPVKEVSNAYAEFAKRYGVSIDTLVKARRSFSTVLMGDLSKTDELRDQILTKFKQQNISQSVALEQIVKYSDLFARNGLRFADSFVRAAADAKKIGVDLGKIDQIGDSIIGDFEGFLEKSAELGAMGFNLDTNTLSQLAEGGDTGALFNELRSQLAATGKDITKLRRSEQLALSGAFGISMADIQRLAGNTPQEKTSEDLLEDSNSTLAQILSAMKAFSQIAGVLKFAMEITLLQKLTELTTAVLKILSIFTESELEKSVKKGDVQGAALAGAKTSGVRGLAAGAATGAGIGLALTPFVGPGVAVTVPVGALVGGIVGGISGVIKGGYQGAAAAAGKKMMDQQPPGTFQLDSNYVNPDTPILGPRVRNRTPIPTGSPILNRAAGGLVTGPGTGKSDSISARLSNGEFVINADMVKKLGLPFLNKLNTDAIKGTTIERLLSKAPMLSTGISKAQELKTGGVEGLFSMAQSKFGDMFGGKAGGMMSSISNLFTGGGSTSSNLMGLASKIPGIGGLLGKATGLLGGGGLKGLAGNLLGKVGLGSIGGGLLGGPVGMLGSLAAPLLKKIPFVGSALSSIAGGPSKLIGSALGKLGGLFGKKKSPVASAIGAMMPDMGGLMSQLPMLSGMMGNPQQSNQNISVNTSGIEQKLDQKLSNFITALSNIQVNMDGTKVGKLLVNVNDAAMAVGVFGAQSR